jgi:uncharacterized coiled-coil protein SlyX
MSAIQELYKKINVSKIEDLLMRVTNYAWSEMTLLEQQELRELAATELADLRARLDQAIAWHEGDDSPHAQLEQRIASLEASNAKAREALLELAQAVDDNNGECERFSTSLHSVAMELRTLAAAHGGEG